VIALVVAAVILVSIVVLLVVLVLLELRRKRQRRPVAASAVVTPAPIQSAPPAAAVASEPAPPHPTTPPPDDALLTTAYLQVNTTGAPPKRYPLEAAVITIGRDPACTIPVAESLTPVSRRHAQIERDGDEYILTDLGSENGLFVDGVRAGRNLLRDGAVITLAQVVSFTFHANHRNQP
jgi:pSer/pThr/pTyr-binding forkhead associated (FHA) protein